MTLKSEQDDLACPLTPMSVAKNRNPGATTPKYWLPLCPWFAGGPWTKFVHLWAALVTRVWLQPSSFVPLETLGSKCPWKTRKHSNHLSRVSRGLQSWNENWSLCPGNAEACIGSLYTAVLLNLPVLGFMVNVDKCDWPGRLLNYRATQQ